MCTALVAGLSAASAPALGPTGAIPRGVYFVDSTQGRDVGEIWIDRTGTHFAPGTAIGIEWHCPRGYPIDDQIVPVGGRIAPDGRFAFRDRTYDVANRTVGIARISGVFASRRAHGIAWGWNTQRNCRIRSTHPVRFTARYIRRAPR
jgi:hypothetical protein